MGLKKKLEELKSENFIRTHLAPKNATKSRTNSFKTNFGAFGILEGIAEISFLDKRI